MNKTCFLDQNRQFMNSKKRNLMKKLEDLNIVLIYPSTHDSVQSLFTFHKNEGIGIKPPLGIMIIASYLKSKGIKNVSCLDCQIGNISPEETLRRLDGMNPDIVGLSAWTDFWYPTHQTISLIKKHMPETKIVIGGPHCSIFPEETLKYSSADYVIVGDGEESLYRLLCNFYSENEMLESIPGLWYKKQGEVFAPNEPRAIVSDVSSIPIPDRALLSYKDYNSILNSHEYETTMVTSRGCPHKCIFCKMHVQKVYARDAKLVVDEFQSIADMGITDIQVYDDTFTWSKQRVLDICNGILERKIKINWAIRDRVDKADDETYALMRKAGCYRIHFGVESGSPPILKKSGKNITLEQVENAVNLAKKHKFQTMSYYMFGFPDETYEDALKTIDFSIKLNTDYAVYAVIIPYPGTELYKIALDRKIILHDFWIDFVKSPTPNFLIPHFIEQNMDKNTLISLKNRALREYYFRPSVLIKELLKIRTTSDFIGKAKMGINILTDSLKFGDKSPSSKR